MIPPHIPNHDTSTMQVCVCVYVWLGSVWVWVWVGWQGGFIPLMAFGCGCVGRGYMYGCLFVSGCGRALVFVGG